MKRRKFIQLSSLATLPLLLKSCDWIGAGSDFEVTVFTDIHTGHLLFESQHYPLEKTETTETLIVGGGIAGLSAASQLKGKDFMLCELSDDLGGTSSWHEYNGVTFAQGAHYDLAYPANYGDEVLGLLESLDIVEYQKWKDAWSFKDSQYIVTHRRKSQCFDHGVLREEVLPNGTLREDFYKIMSTYEGFMTMPTRLIDSAYHDLNRVSFIDFLKGKLNLSPEFIRGLDYHMLDDWGGTASQVSALAGVHYFACRPYYSQVVDLFSPPQGNGYFIEKMAAVHKEGLFTKHLVKSIVEKDDGFEVDVIDIERKAIKRINADKVIYAGQKHALKYILPDQYSLFEANQYAPWLVLNFIINDELPRPGYWQNEMLTEDQTFMGFVDSDMQQTTVAGKRVLTAYYCLPPESREDLRNVEANKQVIAEKTLEYLNQYFKRDIRSLVEHVYIKVMGHAMPIPGPGYLLNDKNAIRKHKNLTFAGVDNGRLPLLFEAVDSGLEAVKFRKG
ncbi:MAG: NAD(P)-binding protein [Roseivirga sp.]|nr:NAD(P)-binding protein [Roseivirga sp.]